MDDAVVLTPLISVIVRRQVRGELSEHCGQTLMNEWVQGARTHSLQEL
jgi:hypothetical protein